MKNIISRYYLPPAATMPQPPLPLCTSQIKISKNDRVHNLNHMSNSRIPIFHHLKSCSIMKPELHITLESI